MGRHRRSSGVFYLVYGIGRHACPGRLLATIELRVVIRALLAGTATLTLDPDIPPEREIAPVGGWARVPILLSDTQGHQLGRDSACQA